MKTRMKVLALILCAAMLFGVLPASASTAQETATLSYRGITIDVDGKEIVPVDVNGKAADPFIIDGTTYLPVRAVAGALGLAADWDGDTSTVILTSGASAGTAPAAGEKKTGTAEAALAYRNIKITVDGVRASLTDVNGRTVEPFIIDGTTYLPVRAIAQALGCEVEWYAKDSRIGITSADKAVFRAGAGGAPIKFDAAMFPIEGFGGEVNDDPDARVLVLNNGTKVAIVSLELVNASEEAVAIVKQVVGDTCGVDRDKIWVHQTHAITTMHGPSDEAKNALYLASIRTAITAAAEQAAASYQPAVMGVETVELDVNANRDIEIDGEWYFGMGSTRPSNKTMTMLRFDAAEGGKTIGYFISYGIKPTAIDNTQMSKDIRVISADVPGVACDIMEAELGVPTMFVMPAAGDQIPAEVAYYYEDAARDENGKPVVVELEIPEAVALMERQGKVMGDACVALAKKIACNVTDPKIAVKDSYFTFENKAGDGEVKIDVSVMQLGGDVAFVGLKPEVSAATELDLWEKSPYKHTLIVSFLNGDQKYMPEAEAYDLNTWAAKRAGGAKGTAEKFVETAVALLKELKADQSAVASVFQAGAGAAPIKFDAAMFPIEGFGGEVNDDPYARVLVLDNGTKAAIVSLELVNASTEAVDIVKDVVNEACGVEKANIWVHQTHAITTMHGPSDEAKNALYLASVKTAITAAAKQAAESFRPATMGVATATLDVNANRDIEIDGEWYFGMGSTRPSNKTMTILRFNDLEGKAIGFFVSYGIKPTAIDNTQMSKDIRVISADVPGVAMTDMEAALGAPAMFVMPAAGDQIPAEVAYYYEDASRDENGKPVVVELEIPEAVALMERQGHQMGDACIDLAKRIVCNDPDPEIIHAATSFTFANKAGDGEVEIGVSGLQIGQDVALVGLKPEVSAATELDLWARSPYEHTLIVSFLNGDQKYMPEAEAYDLNTWAAKRAGGAKGTAEKFVDTAVALLKDIRDGKAGGVSADTGASGGSDATYSTVEFGGTTWYVLDKKDGKSLLLSEYVLEHRAYNDTDEAITWEDSTLRAYLNGEFYEKTFSAAEKAQIAETENLNRSNSHYGIPGGNATTDKVFLLSLDEATQYLLGYSALLNAKDKTSGEIVWWHLRSPGEATNVAACVGANGLIDDHGVVGGVSDPEGGVRPAIWAALG